MFTHKNCVYQKGSVLSPSLYVAYGSGNLLAEMEPVSTLICSEYCIWSGA